MKKCKYCSKEYSDNGIGTHIWRNHGAGKNHNPNIGYENGSRIVWNKGLTKETDERVSQYTNTIQTGYQSGRITNGWKGKHHTEDSKLKMSKARSLNNKGGRCKWFEYIKPNGEIIKLQGTWEVRFAKVLDLLDENWERPKSFLWFDDNHKQHYYTPDFYSPKLNKYFEVKGYWWGDDKRKMELVIAQQPLHRFEIIRKKELENYEKLIR